MYLAIDIGTNSIKAIEKDAKGNPLKWGILERQESAFQTSIYPLHEGEAVYYLAKLLEKMSVDGKEVVASVPNFLTFTAIADSPDFAFIPAAPGTFKATSFALENGKYFLTAIPNEVVEKYESIFCVLGLNLLRLEPESIALARNLGNVQSPSLIVDVGGRSTNFVLAQKELPYFVSHTDFAMASKNPDVIINKTQNLLAEHSAKKVILANQFSVANGL